MKNRIGKAIQTIRANAGLTQNQLSLVSGVSQQHISRIENGFRLPRIDILLDIALALNVTPDFILIEAGVLPGGDDKNLSEGGYLYQISKKLVPEERERVTEYANWRLAEQERKNSLCKNNEGGQSDGETTDQG